MNKTMKLRLFTCCAAFFAMGILTTLGFLTPFPNNLIILILLLPSFGLGVSNMMILIEGDKYDSNKPL